MVLIDRTDRKYWSQAEGEQYWIDTEEFDQQQQAKTMQLSTYQQAVLDAIKQRITANERPLKGLLIEALAGSGKSTMLWLIAQVLSEYGYTPSECRFVVFGKKNQLDLSAKMSSKVGKKWGKSVSTLHSLSFAILRDVLGQPAHRFKVENFKYRKIAQDFQLISYWNGSQREEGELIREKKCKSAIDFLEVVEKLRLYCLESTVENVVYIKERHKLEIFDCGAVAIAAEKVLTKGLQSAINNLWLDFTDQSWVLWHRRNLPSAQSAITSWRKQLKFIAVDECQDTDQLQIEILDLLRDSNHSFITCVGDKWQAVYAFRGCLSDGLEKMQSRFDCEKLPLPVNYRCGKSHLKLVREIFPHIKIEPHQNAYEGQIRCITEKDFLSIFDSKSYDDYFGIYRKNAPLISYAINLLTNGIPAKVKDKNLGAKIVGYVQDICKTTGVNYDPQTFAHVISRYEQLEIERLNKYPDGEERIEQLQDLLGAITALFDSYKPTSIDGWKQVIDRIFDENDNQSVGLFTVHSGKGGEGRTTFIIHPHLMPMSHRKQSAEEAQQERNLLYVSLTRPLCDSTDNGILYLVLQLKQGKPEWPTWLPSEYRKLYKEGAEEEEAYATEITSRDLVADQKYQHSSRLDTDVKQDATNQDQLSSTLEGLEEALTHCAGDWYGTAQVLRLIREELKADFASYCKDKFGWSKRHCERLIAASVVVDNLINAGLISGEIPNESVIRPLANLTTEQQLKVWELASSYERITANLIEQLKAEVLTQTIDKVDLVNQLINKFGIEYLVQMLQCNSEEEASDSTKSFCKGCGAEIF
ncbi:MAG: UvrD-helicase domain-containing protein (plasmid) [Phormidium sp.]